MRVVSRWIVVGILFVSGIGTTSGAAIDFEPPAFLLGTDYGTPAGHVPGTVVFNVWDVEASVRNFTLGAFVGFNFANIAGHPGPPTSYFPPAINPTQVLQFNNINMAFDFRGVPGEVIGVRFDYVDRGGDLRTIRLASGSLMFTFCQIPVVYSLADQNSIVLTLQAESKVEIDALALDVAWSTSIFKREGKVRRIDVFLTCDFSIVNQS